MKTTIKFIEDRLGFAVNPRNSACELNYEDIIKMMDAYVEYKSGSNISNSDIIEIINELNKVCNKSYKHNTAGTKRHIKSRLKEGFTVDDFKLVIAEKNRQWGNDEKFKLYLRPETLFSPKFESYLNEAKDNLPKPKKTYQGWS